VGVVRGDQLVPLGSFTTTAGFLSRGRALAFEVAANSDATADQNVNLAAVEVLRPVSGDARILCQGANYRQYMIESGMNPDAKPFNMFFNKSSASLCAAGRPIVRPPHVKLMDYEI
jgi:2-keto-4-pentenoate hydratase/2-oxohepta-3-ene-1,7-dioic acid hydratase in catechol pathway